MEKINGTTYALLPGEACNECAACNDKELCDALATACMEPESKEKVWKKVIDKEISKV